MSLLHSFLFLVVVCLSERSALLMYRRLKKELKRRKECVLEWVHSRRRRSRAKKNQGRRRDSLGGGGIDRELKIELETKRHRNYTEKQ